MARSESDDDADVERAAAAQEARDRALQCPRHVDASEDAKMGDEGAHAAVRMLSSIRKSSEHDRADEEAQRARRDARDGGADSGDSDAHNTQEEGTSAQRRKEFTKEGDADAERAATTLLKQKKRRRSEASEPSVAVTPASAHGPRRSVQQQRESTSAASPLSPSTSNATARSRTARKSLDAQEDDVMTMKIETSAPPTVFGGIGAPTADIPAAFTATQAFVSPRDFFVAPWNSEDDPKSAVDGSQHVECTLCRVLMGNRVYTLKRHLYRHHPEVFRISATVSSSSSDGDANRECVGKDSRSENGNVATTLKQEPSSKTDEDAARAAARNDAFVAWLRSEIIPMKAVRSETFRDFLNALNPRFVLPDVAVEPRSPTAEHGAVSVAKLSPARATRFMKGFCLAGDGRPPKIVDDVVVPTPGANEALIRIVRAGICGTDLMMVDNYKSGFKGVLGHEFVGIVEALGDEEVSGTEEENKAHENMAAERNRAWLGKRVVGEINIPCDDSTCATCQRAAAASAKENDSAATRAQIKKRNHCPHRAALGIVRKDGVFAEFIMLPLHNLFVVPDSVVDAHAVFAEPLAAACRIVEQHVIDSSHDVAVLGDSKLGLLCAEVLHALGAANTVTLIGKHVPKLALMKHVVHATHTVDECATALRNTRFDVCVECTGTPSGASLALRLVKRGGAVVMKSTCAAASSRVDVAAAHAKRARVIGSRCGPFAMALALLRDKRVDVQKFVHGVYPLGRADDALAHAACRGALKIQLVVV